MFQAGQQIGLYTLIAKLAKGGFGEVWLAEKRSEFVTKKVAIKLPLDEQVDFEEIRQEATLWEKASGHPNVLPIIDADIYGGQVAIVSEYADGGSLGDKLKAEGRFSVRAAVEMTIGILNGLDYLHSKKIVHRDIKPANILLQGGTPRLADFGISRAIHAVTVSSVVIGTEAYMAPESFEGKRSVQTDIWSVGVVIYQLLKGSLPFPQKNANEVMYAILLKEPEPLPGDVPARLREIVFKALEKDRELNGKPPQRYQTAAALREDLKMFLETFSRQVAPPVEASSSIKLPEQEQITSVRRKVPITLDAKGWRTAGQTLIKKENSPTVVFSVILAGAAFIWLLVYLFGQNSAVDSNAAGSAPAAVSSVNTVSGNTASNSNAPMSSQTVLEHFQEGNKFYTRKQFDRAIAAYTKAIELNPSDFTFYNNRGLAYYSKKSFDEAIADFNKAIELSPTAANYNNRGVAYEDKGEREQAIADYQKALEIDPSYQTANENLNKILR